MYFWDKTGGSPTLQKDVTTIQRFFTTVVEHFCGLQANSFAPYVMAFLTVVNTYFTQNIYAEIFLICPFIHIYSIKNNFIVILIVLFLSECDSWTQLLSKMKKNSVVSLIYQVKLAREKCVKTWSRFITCFDFLFCKKKVVTTRLFYDSVPLISKQGNISICEHCCGKVVCTVQSRWKV